MFPSLFIEVNFLLGTGFDEEHPVRISEAALTIPDVRPDTLVKKPQCVDLLSCSSMTERLEIDMAWKFLDASHGFLGRKLLRKSEGQRKVVLNSDSTMSCGCTVSAWFLGINVVDDRQLSAVLARNLRL